MKNLISILLVLLAFSAFSQDRAYKQCYPNGNVKEIGYFNNKGQLTGEWLAYDENGKITSTAHYVDGVKQGEWTISTPDKTIVILYVDGKKSEYKELGIDGSVVFYKKF